MIEYWECSASEEIFKSVRNFVRDKYDSTSNRMIAYDGHIQQIIGYGIQLCYDLNEVEVDCCIRCIERFQSLSDWREFLLQFVDAIHQHVEFENEREWQKWSCQFVCEHTDPNWRWIWREE